MITLGEYSLNDEKRTKAVVCAVVHGRAIGYLEWPDSAQIQSLDWNAKNGSFANGSHSDMDLVVDNSAQMKEIIKLIEGSEPLQYKISYSFRRITELEDELAKANCDAMWLAGGFFAATAMAIWGWLV